MKKYILSLDQGTTSSRAILFDSNGNPISVSQQEFTQHFPKAGWVEHDPYEILNTQLETARETIKKAKITANDIAGIGITNQRETTILWEKDSGKPVYNAIVWQCRRTTDICDNLKRDNLEETFHKKTGLLLDPYFSGTKIKWILDNVEGVRERAQKGEILFGTIDSWLIYNLTNQHVTDPSNASRTLLYNIHTGEWDDELLRILNIPPQILPKVSKSSGEIATTKKEIFGSEIPISGIAGDQQAALFGQLCFSKGTIKITYGTGSFTLLNTGATPIISENGLLTTVAWDIGEGLQYALEGSVFIAGAVVQWLRDKLMILEKASESEQMAKSVDDTNGVYFVPAFVGLGAPHWEPNVRGTMVGLTRGTEREHIVRAALESIAYQNKDLIDAMKRDYKGGIEQIKADGGAAMNSFLMQFQADILKLPVTVPEINETTALGAAYLAGLGVGVWSDPTKLSEYWKVRAHYTPTMDETTRNQKLKGWGKALKAAKAF